MNSSMPIAEENKGADVVPMWMTRRELCEHFGVSVRTLRKLTKLGAVERRFVDKKALYRPLVTKTELAAHPDLDLRSEGRDDPDRSPPTLVAITTHPVPDDAIPGTPLLTDDHRPRRAADRDAARLLSVAKAALKQRDRLADEKADVVAERDALREKLMRVETAVERAHEQRVQADERAQRAADQRDRATTQRDALLDRLDRVLDQRDKATEQRDELLSRLDDVIDQRDKAIEQFQRAHDMLRDWKVWREEAQATLDRYEERTERAAMLTAAALSTPWWSFARRKEIEQKLRDLAAE
jgi:hypothetical protein